MFFAHPSIEKMDKDDQDSRKSTWKPIYLVLNALLMLELVVYLGAVVYFAPLLDVVFPVFTTAETWKWVFPLIAVPLISYIFYLIESLKHEDTNKSAVEIFMLVLGLTYLAALLVIIGFNFAEWVAHCTSSATTPYSYCWAAGARTAQWDFVFWTSVVHTVLFGAMLWVAWYTVHEGILTMSMKVNSRLESTYTQMSTRSSAKRGGSGAFA